MIIKRNDLMPSGSGREEACDSAPLVSIIVPIFNTRAYLERCLHSIVNQSYRNLEIILVDDGSTDGSGEIADHAGKHDSRIIVTHKPNGGLSSARNVGLDAVKGDYIAFIDSDDFIHRNYVTELVGISCRHHCDIVQCAIEKGKRDYFMNKIPRNKMKVKVVSQFEAFRGYELKAIVCNKLFKSHLFLELRFPEGRINEDEFITYKAVYASHKIGMVNTILYYYFQSPGSITRGSTNLLQTDFMDAFEERMEFFNMMAEPELKALSAEKYCVSLMLKYIIVNMNGLDNGFQEVLLCKLKELIPEVKGCRQTSKSVLLLLLLFGTCPKLTGKLLTSVGIVR